MLCLLPDAELAEDAVDQVGIDGLAEDLAERVVGGAQVDGDEVRPKVCGEGLCRRREMRLCAAQCLDFALLVWERPIAEVALPPNDVRGDLLPQGIKPRALLRRDAEDGRSDGGKVRRTQYGGAILLAAEHDGICRCCRKTRKERVILRGQRL